MDWLDERLEKLQKKITNLSLRKAICFYMLLFIAIVIILILITLSICDRWDNFIWSKYSTYDLQEMGNSVVYIKDYSKLSELDRVLVTIINYIQTWNGIIYSIGGIAGASYLFYKNKLKEPLEILKEATSKIGNNDLAIEIQYDSKDEMGELCLSFDSMRRQLIANNQKMWDVMEEQKRLNAAFAHDLRTPLTVLRGYTDFLNQYVPEGKVNEDKLVSTLLLMSDHITRLERYSNTMKEISSLEEVPIHRKPMQLGSFWEKLEETLSVINDNNEITISLSNLVQAKEIHLNLDEAIVMEVFENLLSNALRYAKSEIEVFLSIYEDGKQILLSVSDDGKGFTSKDLLMATKPYYTDSKNNTDNRLSHFGIGLYICKILCEKHGGSIVLANRIQHGAIVTASFDTIS